MIKVIMIHAPFYGAKFGLLNSLNLTNVKKLEPGSIEISRFLFCELYCLRARSGAVLLMLDVYANHEYLSVIDSLCNEIDAILDFVNPDTPSAEETRIIDNLTKIPVYKFDLNKFDQLVADRRSWEEKDEERITLYRDIFEQSRQFLIETISIDIGEPIETCSELPDTFDRLPSLKPLKENSFVFGEDELSQSLKRALFPGIDAG